LSRLDYGRLRPDERRHEPEPEKAPSLDGKVKDWLL
jgi:hypothetical protein